jgi:hypothetical protein
MLRDRIYHTLSWASLALMLLSGLGLIILSWNGVVKESVSPASLILLWCCMCASGIYLFLLAVKETRPKWINGKNEGNQSGTREVERERNRERQPRDEKGLEFAATARKIVRRFPEGSSLEQSGQELLKNLASELELMSGILYLRKRGKFQASASYALPSPLEPEAFKEGEGLTGQAARNRQIMMLTRLPEGHLEVYSGLGKSSPAYLVIVPLVAGDRTLAVLECSGYRYDPHDVESMFRILARDLMHKISDEKK